MQNFKLVLEYDGTRYSGWQRIPGKDSTIQGKLEDVLSRMTGQSVQVIGAGRTDAGVHARGQTANAHLETERSAAEIKTYLNHYLPEDIRVLSVEGAEPRFHSRYHAQEKCYSYTVGIGEKAPVFARKYLYQLKRQEEARPLDVEAMRRAASALCGTHDYTSFCANKHMKKSAVRTVYEISIDQKEELLHFCFRGDGFLYHMIRILVGTLLEVGAGKRSADSMPGLLAARDRAQAGYTVPACGLCLEWVTYKG